MVAPPAYSRSRTRSPCPHSLVYRVVISTTLFSACLLVPHITIHSYFQTQFHAPQTVIPGRTPTSLDGLVYLSGSTDRRVISSKSNLTNPQIARIQFPNDPADFSTFDNTTSLNYFHMHKTGGLSFKHRLFAFFFKHRTSKHTANVFDTCHTSSITRKDLGIEKRWACNWHQLQNLSEHARNNIDVIVGHQYWKKGASYWIPKRDIRYFTVLRHPLHRKISFFYHFFVRNAGRDESSVDFDELKEFVLSRNVPHSPLLRDAGPGYYAGRLWSDGMSGYDESHRFVVPEGKAVSLVNSSVRRLRRHFVFIGLQSQEAACLCMLRKTVEAFVRAHGFGYDGGLEEFDRQRERMNIGRYSLSAKVLWQRMNESERNEFRILERVDLGIYREGVVLFREMVKRFGCEEAVVEDEDDDLFW